MTPSLPLDVHLTQPAIGLGDQCEPVLRSLPDWFGLEEPIVAYAEAINSMPTVLAMHDGSVVGFMTIEQHFPTSAEIHVTAVREPWHRRGIGTALLRQCEREALAAGTRFLQVKTLSPRRECEAYHRTRLWYEAMGFVTLTEFPTLWDAANPCLQMIKVL